MLKKIAEEISLILVSNRIITIENRKYYIYGIELLLNDFLIFLIITVIALITKTILVSLFFALPFCVLRAYVGGYHCKTYFTCFSVTLINYISMLILNRIIVDHKLIISCILIGISILLIIKLTPVEHENKPLSNAEKKKYKIISIILLCLVMTSFIISLVFLKFEISFAISWAIFAVFLLLIPTIQLIGGKKHD